MKFEEVTESPLQNQVVPRNQENNAIGTLQKPKQNHDKSEHSGKVDAGGCNLKTLEKCNVTIQVDIPGTWMPDEAHATIHDSLG